MSRYEFRSLTVKLLPDDARQEVAQQCPGGTRILCAFPSLCAYPSICGQCSQLISCAGCSVIISICDPCSRASVCGECSQFVSCGPCSQLASIHCTGVSCAGGSAFDTTEIIRETPYRFEQVLEQGLDVREELGVLKLALQEALARTEEVEAKVMSAGKPGTLEETESLRQSLLDAVAELDEHKGTIEREQKS